MRLRIVRISAMSAGIVLALSAPAYAHKADTFAGYHLEIGWGTEPAVAGFPNTVVVAVERAGKPVTDAHLKAQVIFGQLAMDTMDLEPSDEAPGEYLGSVIPTTPGTYTFHVTGSFGKASFDKSYASGDGSFDDVKDSSALLFPPQQKSDVAALATRGNERAVAAKNQASGARALALVGIGAGALAILLGAAALMRRRAPAS